MLRDWRPITLPLGNELRGSANERKSCRRPNEQQLRERAEKEQNCYFLFCSAGETHECRIAGPEFPSPENWFTIIGADIDLLITFGSVGNSREMDEALRLYKEQKWLRSLPSFGRFDCRLPANAFGRWAEREIEISGGLFTSECKQKKFNFRNQNACWVRRK